MQILFSDSTQLQCSNYKVGQSFKLDKCVSCLCLASRLYANPLYSNATCSKTSCPTLNCPLSNITFPTESCCATCSCSISITNCPAEPQQLILDPGQNFKIYEFQPTVKDCKQLGREIQISKTPMGDIYTWKGVNDIYDVKVVATARSVSGIGNDKATCQFQVKVIGKLLL